MRKETVISISLLTAGKKPELEKCLKSLQPLMQAVASELIIVDTGCNKESRSLIEHYATQIVDFTWCNDFAKARNAGLEKASGEWFLYLDDDEWFDDVTELIYFFQTGEYRQYESAMYIQRNYENMQGTSYEDAPVGRMIKLRPDVKFIYSIHECFNKKAERIKFLQCYVHHYGYVYSNCEERLRHAQRNIQPLLEEHKRNPDNLRHVLQLTQEYGSLEDYQKSIEIGEEGIRNFKGEDFEQLFYWNSIAVSNLKGYLLLDMYEKVVQEGKKYLKSDYLNIMSQAYVLVLMAQGCRGCGIESEVIVCVDKYLQIRNDYEREPERFYICASSVTANCFSTKVLMTVLNTGLVTALHLGDWERIAKWCRHIPFEAEGICIDKTIIEGVTEGLWKTVGTNREFCRQTCDCIVVHPQIAEMMRTLLEEKLQNTEGIEQRNVLEEMIRLPAEEWYWEKDWEIQRAVAEGRSDIWELFFQYADSQLAWADFVKGKSNKEVPYFKTNSFMSAMTILEIKKGLAEEDYQVIPALLKKLLDLKPSWKESIRLCLNDIRELLAAQANMQVQETVMLAQKVKEQVQLLIAQGKKREATEILKQLQMMVPEDEEVKELLKEYHG